MIFGYGYTVTDFTMKPLYKKVIQFFKKEWFLLVILTVIALIIFAFEYFRR